MIRSGKMTRMLRNAEERYPSPFTGDFNPVLKPPDLPVCVVNHHGGFLSQKVWQTMSRFLLDPPPRSSWIPLPIISLDDLRPLDSSPSNPLRFPLSGSISPPSTPFYFLLDPPSWINPGRSSPLLH